VATAAAIRAPVTDAGALVNYLSDRRMFVVLDNCEHIIGDVADLVDSLLEATADIHVVTTSREPLGLDGEVVRRVASLGNASDDATVDEALGTPAVRLFVERAAAVVDQFTLEDTTVASVVEICRRLDGIPLAIELAAARMRSMPADEISRRLDERFRLLSGGSRRAQERHRTLAATVSWSHDLLTADDQAVFRCLAVFPASFGLDAAEAVTAGSETTGDVVDCLLSLVDRSLVQYDPEHGRYRLLETLRQYAADRLAEAGETEASRERHARYFLELAERLGPDLLGARYNSTIAMLAAELDNLRAAATWCIDLDHWCELATLCRQTFLLAHQEAPVDGADWRRHVVEHDSEVPVDEVVAALGEHAYLEGQSLGDFEESIRLAEASRELADAAGLQHSPWEGIALSSVFVMTGRSADALPVAERATEVAQAAGSFGPLVTALLMCSSALSGMDESERSAAVAAEALRQAETSGSPLNISAAVTTVASNYLNLRGGPDFEVSRKVIEARPEMLTMAGSSEMWLCLMMGWTLVGLGESAAVGFLSRALRLADRLNAPHVSESALRLLALAFIHAEHEEEAESLLGYVEDRLAPHRMGSPGQAWIQSQLDKVRTGTAQTTRIPMVRGELLNLVASVERSIELGRQSTIAGGDPVNPTSA
jgi:predicted ATPase